MNRRRSNNHALRLCNWVGKSAAVPIKPWLTIGLYSPESCEFCNAGSRSGQSISCETQAPRDADRLDGGSRDSWRPSSKETKTDRITVTVFDDQAAWIKGNVSKGQPVIAEGRISNSSYERTRDASTRQIWLQRPSMRSRPQIINAKD
jgi:hypothetical protein